MDPYLGEIKLFPFGLVPQGWVLCDGRQLPVAGNQALYSLLGNAYGGDTRNFNLPDLRGRVPVHCNYNINPDGKDRILSKYGKGMGAETVTLDNTQLPAHAHQVYGEGSSSDSVSPISLSTCLWAIPIDPTTKQQIPVEPFSTAQVTAKMDSTAITAAGGSGAHDNMQPFLVLNFCIAVQGIYPPRP
ncbi:MAG: tail fiber protein [Geobacteraceae bacterium]|nr:tail fiber protein [Geobacteraceae bacterium]